MASGRDDLIDRHNGVQVFERFGRALAVGDFDHDGYVDLAIGGAKTISGKYSAGSVSVAHGWYGAWFWGMGNIAGYTFQNLRQGSGGIPDLAETGDEFGAALAAGDFDGDTHSDLAIGVPGESVPRFNPRTRSWDAIERAGAVNVLYGVPSGLESEGGDFWHQDK